MNQTEFTKIMESLDTMTPEQLRDLNHEIVYALKNHYRHQSIVSAAKFKVGDLVSWHSKHGGTIQGTITKINTKSIAVDTVSNGKWKVSPGLLSKLHQVK